MVWGGGLWWPNIRKHLQKRFAYNVGSICGGQVHGEVDKTRDSDQSAPGLLPIARDTITLSAPSLNEKYVCSFADPRVWRMLVVC